MDDHIRVSDADRERVTARLREHYAEGRLTSDELDERVTAALNAKTFGDLRAIMADLPDSEFAPPQPPPPAMAPWGTRNTFVMPRPRLLPLVLLALFVAIAIPSAGVLFVAFFKVLLVLGLALFVAGAVAAGRLRRNMRRHWKSGYWNSASGDQWRQWHSYHHGRNPWDQSSGSGGPDV
jgi:hypothetical protein